MTGSIQTHMVPHLGGIQVGYKISEDKINPTKPTLVLINPFTTTVDYYSPEFRNSRLREVCNLLAVEPLGHGRTQPLKSETYTYWDSAMMILQLLDVLGVEKVFALGTSQGGWMAVRMALLAPQKVEGIIAIGSSMDYESVRSRELGCWNGPEACAGLLSIAGGPEPAHDFEPGDGYVEFLMDIGYGKSVTQDLKDFWARTIALNYSGDAGKRRICMAAVNLASRDGLRERLPYVTCPILWLQGTADVVFSVANAEEQIKLFKNSKEAKLVPFTDGVHFLSYTHEQEVQNELLKFIRTWGKPVKTSL